MKKNQIKILIVMLTIFLIIFGNTLNAYSISEATTDKESNKKPTIISRKYALIIGTGIISCPYSNNDANDMKKVLINNGWNPLNIRTLKGLFFARKQIILNSITNWLDSKEDKNDMVLIYFSGHGHYGKIKTATILMGVDPGRYEINSQELDNAVSKLESEKIVIVFDSCYSGSFTDLINPLSKTGRTILSSCNSIELSRADQKKSNGIFTYYFTKALDFANGLTESDKNNDEKISVKEAFTYAKIRTNLKLQHPQSYYGTSKDLTITEKGILSNDV